MPITHAIVAPATSLVRLHPIRIVSPFGGVMSPVSSLVRVDYSFHVLPMTIRAGLVDIAADGEQPIRVFRLGCTDRLLAGVDHILRALHPLAAILGARHQ